MTQLLSQDREDIFDRLSKLVGSTPIYEIKNIEIANECRIFCKEENLNPTGSHYDRFWVDYLRWYEIQEQYKPELPIVETSTGNSGASFAWVCRALGYPDYRIVIPADMPYARKQQIRSYGATLRESPKGQYVKGLIDEFKKYLKELKVELGVDKNPTPNHDLAGEACLGTMEVIATEIIEKLKSKRVYHIDYFVSALGNGLSTKGIGNVLKSRCKSIIVGMEPTEAPTVYYKRNVSETKPSTYGSTHGLIGTGPGDTGFPFPIMDSYVDQIDQFLLVQETDWQKTSIKLADYEGKFVGHTSAACVFAALEIAKKAQKKSIIVTIFYDSDWKYL